MQVLVFTRAEIPDISQSIGVLSTWVYTGENSAGAPKKLEKMTVNTVTRILMVAAQ